MSLENDLISYPDKSVLEDSLAEKLGKFIQRYLALSQDTRVYLSTDQRTGLLPVSGHLLRLKEVQDELNRDLVRLPLQSGVNSSLLIFVQLIGFPKLSLELFAESVPDLVDHVHLVTDALAIVSISNLLILLCRCFLLV